MSQNKWIVIALGLTCGGVALADGPQGGKVTAPSNTQTVDKPDDKGTQLPKPDQGDLAAQNPPAKEATDASAIVAKWDEHPRTVAQAMVSEYGQPDEAMASRLLWNNSGPWKRTVVVRDEVGHDFPKPHMELIEQTVDYSVPIDKLADLAKFDGSIIVDRTRGELTVLGGDEAMNFATLNLANDVITGKSTPSHARQMLALDSVSMSKKQTPPETQKILFDLPSEQTADPDKPERIKISH